MTSTPASTTSCADLSSTTGHGSPTRPGTAPATQRQPWPLRAAVASIIMLTLALTACGAPPQGANGSPVPLPPLGQGAEAEEIRLGYFPNLTHALPVLGVANGDYQRTLGDTRLTTQVFNAGPTAVEALLSGAIDAAYIGPNPAINAFAQSDGAAVRIISGATSGGAQFVVQPEVTEADLNGRTFATPQLGNTQDVALRFWLSQRGLTAPKSGGGDVNVQPTDNATTLDLFESGEIDGAWVPEPWASRLVLEGGGRVLVDEASLWPQGQFVTTHLLVSTDFLTKYPGTVTKLLTGELTTLATIRAEPEASRDAINVDLEKLTGKALTVGVLTRSWSNLAVQVDPVATSLRTDQAHAEAIGLAKPVDLTGIYDLRILNALLVAAGEPPVASDGLGPE